MMPRSSDKTRGSGKEQRIVIVTCTYARIGGGFTMTLQFQVIVRENKVLEDVNVKDLKISMYN